MADLTPDAPCRWLARDWPSAGPVTARVAACSTALHNLFAAADYVSQGIVDTALTGSTDASLVQLYLASFLRLGALSRDGCFPYDARHAGFAAGEGAAVFILANEKTIEGEDLDPLARIVAWRTSADSWHTTSLRSDGRQVTLLVERLLADAGLQPSDIDLVSTHGTGTAQGDSAEAEALRSIFADRTPPVFSVKGAVGHLMGASGGIEVAACIECLSHGIVPATAGFETLAHDCQRISVHRRSLRRPVRRILKWTLGFGGHLSACILERP